MLFVNFLCLLYLMLLVNGLTVSKNIDNSYFDERVDSLHDFEYTTRHKSKHDKLLHKQRRIKSGVTTPANKVTIRVSTNKAEATEATLRPQHMKIHKSTKRRIGGFWRKFKIKENKKLEREKRLKYEFRNVQYTPENSPFIIKNKSKDNNIHATKRRKNTQTLYFEKKKREAINKEPNMLNQLKDVKKVNNMEINITPYENFSYAFNATPHMKMTSNDEDLKEMLTTMTTKVTELKHRYGLDYYKSSYTPTQKMVYKTKHTTTTTATPTTTENLDIPGTAQLEALLNDIKEKALHMIVEQSPTISDLITNTVTEATFEADPLLTHLQINNPAYSFYTFITLNSEFGKRNANISKQDDEKSKVNVEFSTSYNRQGRSVAEDAMTAAQSIEDVLQKELKNIYKKVKTKLSGDCRKEVKKAKTTPKPQSKKTCDQDPCAKKPDAPKHAAESCKKTKSTTQLLQNRVDRKSGKYTRVTEQEITTTPTPDDFALLTLYEQMLAKTCQNNIMNMVTSEDIIIRKKRNKQMVSHHNFETLFDQNLKEDVKKLYEDREEIPDELEYNFDVNFPEMSTAETITEPDYSHTTSNEESTTKEMEENVNNGVTSYDDNSFEGLSSKISYNEYVNGYKHYLNFQKELGNEKFSNLVRYQAHRHHSVDDIGKYILNKIPQLPSREKRFFEYDDDHDSTTKSAESWFKKHFYMFVDHGTPKKYHTSQTISLKSPTPDSYETSAHKTQDLERYEVDEKRKGSPESEDNVVDISLEKLTRVLEEQKASPAVIPVQENSLKDSISKNTGKRHGHIFKSWTPHIIDKVFGKDRKAFEAVDVGGNNADSNLGIDYLAYDRDKQQPFLLPNKPNRIKRDGKNPREKSTPSENPKFQTKKSARLINLTKTKKTTDNAKVGCVDIDLVVPPTAIVKLKDTKRKEGKLKKFLQKLHLSHSDKKKVKREYFNMEHTRKERSNPFQKLKDMFKVTQKGKDLKAGSHLSDYDIISSHIDTFKPLKFDKVLNIEEMKKQIPNITGDISTSASAKFSDSDRSWNPRTTEKGFTDFAILLNTTLKNLPVIPATNSPHLVGGSTKYSAAKTTKKIKMKNIEELLKINVETKSTSAPYKKIISYPQHMPLDDIKDQLENIIIKINSDDDSKRYSTEAITNSKFLITNKLPLNRVTLTSNLKSFYTNIPKNNKLTKSNFKIRPNFDKRLVLDLEHNSEFVEDNSYFRTIKPGFVVDELFTAQTPISTLGSTGSLLSLGHFRNNEEKEKYKPYPDYFSDLLMWNKDLLNSDSVPTPWRDILKNMNQELEYTTPDMGELSQELIRINDGLNPNIISYKESPTTTFNHEGITPRNWVQSMVLEKPPISKSIFIEQEKKIVKFNPKIPDRQLKAADFVNELNKFAKTFSDETKFKLNKLHNAPENYFESKQNKDQSAILVDTTLLAYDDDVNYISTLTPRELSKTDLKIANFGNRVHASLKTKSNKQPLQYFATPIPMKMTDFEEFLKANRIDVESVTSPIVDLPTVNTKSFKKYTTTKTISNVLTTTTAKKKQKPVKNKTSTNKEQETKKTHSSIKNNEIKKGSQNQFEYLEDLEFDLINDYYNSEAKDRIKRYNELQYNSFTNSNNNLNQYNKENKVMKPKITNKEPIPVTESDLQVNEIPEVTDDMPPKDFEITIINFGDINKLTDEYVPIKSDTTTKKHTEITEMNLRNVEHTPLNIDYIEKGSQDSEFLHKLHNDLFYDHDFVKNKETVTEIPETVKIEETPMPIPPLAFHEAVLKKMPIKTNHEPKRVRISSQSYKYDIIYQHPEKMKKDHGTHFPSYVKLTTAKSTTPEELFSTYNSDFADAGQSDVARSDSSKSRCVRKVKTSSEWRNQDVKTATTTSQQQISKKHPHHHKLKKLFQDKLKKKLLKNSSTFSKYLKNPATALSNTSSLEEKSSNTPSSQSKDTELAEVKKAVTEFLKNYSSDATRNQLKLVTKNKLMTFTPEISSTPKGNTKQIKNAYNEHGIFDKESYSNFDAANKPIRKENKMYNKKDVKSNKDYINKREIQGVETHTAKDVAALEVIVDMMKNPLKCDGSNRCSVNNKNNNSQPNDKVNANTNFIQVHIAVPYEVESSKKRSLEPVKVRKVFTAKLSTPVDIEYQVHSLERPPTTQKPAEHVEGLSPGVYLLVDNTYFPQGIALKPMKVRQVKSTTEKMTSTIPAKNPAKVTLSKDFISAINKELILLYNLTTIDKDKRDINDTKINKTKRSINWDAVNKVFGHDRVCHCKCKVNKTLCSACAASDAVMSELIFEFENLSKYMNDHCTEIQTYFWMNPSGGKRLKDSVHKIDQSLRDYYKRVKGKCQGRTCKTFATFVDKREFHKHRKRSKDAGHNFINDLETIAKDIEKATKTVTCFKETLEGEVQKLKYIINNCMLLKSPIKRSDLLYAQDKDDKNIYTLDKINVNIICNSESTFPYLTSITTQNHDKGMWIESDYKEQKPKGIKAFFSRFRNKKKDKTYTEYFKQTNKPFYKREVKGSQIESPLISDTGGSFWHDYIRKISSEPKFGSESNFKTEVELNKCTKLIKNHLDDKTLFATEAYTEKTSEGEELIHFLKLVSKDVRHIPDFEENPPIHKKITTHKISTKKNKHKKAKTKVHQTLKTKMHKKPDSNNVSKIPNNSSEPEHKSKMKAITENLRVNKSIFNIKSMFKTTKQSTESTTVTKSNILKKIKMLTADFLKNFANTNRSTAPNKREQNLNASAYPSKYNTTTMRMSPSEVHVISDMTTESNQNIIIIDDTDEPTSNSYKDLLLSIIDYESNKLNKEWMRFANFNLNKMDARQSKEQTKKTTTKQTTRTTKKKEKNMTNSGNRHDQGPLLSPETVYTETTISMSALLDKIGSKFKIKFLSDKEAAQQKDKARKKPTTNKIKSEFQSSGIGREADDITTRSRICNIKATKEHILNIRKEMPIKDFEEYVTNVTCQKYDPAPKAIFLGTTRNKNYRNMRNWSWSRDRRSILRYKLKSKATRILPLFSPKFEVFYKGEHGIYKQKIRKKRCADSVDFVNELKDLPRLHDNENEIHAIAGDTVNIKCFNDLEKSFKDLSRDKFTWKTQRDKMIDYSNVVVDGDVVHIFDVKPKNDGYYICRNGGLMKRKIKLAVMALPKLNLLFSLVYSKDTKCSHEDLNRLKLLGPEISKEVFQEQSSVKIINPVCLENKVDGKVKIRAVATVECRRPVVDCNVSCRRDLQAAFALMSAKNIPALATIEVVSLEDGVNRTWRPSKPHQRSIITKKLCSSNDLTNHDRKYPAELTPGSIHLIASCPAGYRLLSHLKICAPCPLNTFAREGDNTCFVCPVGSHSTPGADRCRRTVDRTRRYDWWICPPCGYYVAAVVVLCCCGVCVALALLVQVTSRSCGTTDAQKAKDSTELDEKAKIRRNPDRTRSSRVILARFFKPSLTSSMATDSQETKFDMWKARNLPPPLPPVDFDS